MSAIRIKTGDMVQIIAGKDKGKEGKVTEIDRKKRRVKIEGANMITKHTKPNAANQEGGIVTEEGFLDISNVMYVYNGKPTKLGFEMKDGKKVRVAKENGEVVD